MEQCSEQSIAYKLWEGITENKSAVVNINLAHKRIVGDAKEKKLPYVIIAEDDIKFLDNGAWKYYLSKRPKQFHLYCGVIYDGPTEGNRIISTKGMSGTNTLYTISREFYDTFLNTDNTKNLDRELGKLALQYDFFICQPMVCYQINGKSDHFKRKMNYDEYLVGKKLYGQ